MKRKVFYTVIFLITIHISQFALANGYDDEIKGITDKNNSVIMTAETARVRVKNAIKSLFFEKDTLDALVQNEKVINKIFANGYGGNAAYMFFELGNYYLGMEDLDRASYSYYMSFKYSSDPINHEKLLSFLYDIGMSDSIKSPSYENIQQALSEAKTK